MKILKQQKRQAAARPRKSASVASQAVARKSAPSRAKAVASRPKASATRAATKSSKAVKQVAAAVPQRSHADASYQSAIRNFEIGVKAFQKHDYHKAAEIFEKLVDNDARDVAERAQLHLRLCRQRTGRPAAAPKSAEDHYALGIACLNSRNLDGALEHLSKADKLKPRQDHIQYALAVSRALEGNTEVAFGHLEMAFALRPENRFHARRDEDLQGLAGDPRFRRMVFSGS